LGLKKSELESKLREQDDVIQKLLLFNGHITRLCLQNTKAYMETKGGETKKVKESREIAEFYFKFNVHAFTSYFTKVFFVDNKYSPVVDLDKEWLVKWNDHVVKILNPLYDIELKKIHEKYHPKGKGPEYIL